MLVGNNLCRYYVSYNHILSCMEITSLGAELLALIDFDYVNNYNNSLRD